MHKPEISQQLLQQYQQWHSLEKKYKAQRETLRDQIIALHRHGAGIEKGALDARVVDYEQAILSRAKVEAAIGEPYDDDWP